MTQATTPTRPSRTHNAVLWALGTTGGLTGSIVLLALTDVLVYEGAHLDTIVALAEALSVGDALTAAAGVGALAMGARATAQHWTNGENGDVNE
jgi:hypothetical protein